MYPTHYKDEEEKDDNTHYIYLCTKNSLWKEVYDQYFEKVITDLILYQKNEYLLAEKDYMSSKDEGEK